MIDNQVVRNAYDAARTALGAMMAADGPGGPSAVSVSGAVAAPADVGTTTQGERAQRGWAAAEQLLRAITGHPELSGQSVIAEARRQQRLSLADAHALAALYGWLDRAAAASQLPDAAPDAERAVAERAVAERAVAERAVAREALSALDHGVAASGVTPAASAASAASATSGIDAAAPGASAYIDSVAALGRPAPRDRMQDEWSSGSSHTQQSRTAGASAHASDAYATGASDTVVHRTRRGVDSRIILGAVALLLVALLAYAGWTMFDDRSTDALYRDSVAAYQSGSHEVAQAGFARVAQERPDDVRPLIFLGRIAREQNDMQRSRRFLEAAVEREPRNALAQRELAGTLLADGQPELARRFYVRAVELDPSDRTAQGFLGCALHRLARYDDAKRWFDRAGPGDWMRCITSVAPMPGMNPQQPYPVPPQPMSPYPVPPR